jgi:hypothetical protein
VSSRTKEKIRKAARVTVIILTCPGNPELASYRKLVR